MSTIPPNENQSETGNEQLNQHELSKKRKSPLRRTSQTRAESHSQQQPSTPQQTQNQTTPSQTQEQPQTLQTEQQAAALTAVRRTSTDLKNNGSTLQTQTQNATQPTTNQSQAQTAAQTQSPKLQTTQPPITPHRTHLQQTQSHLTQTQLKPESQVASLSPVLSSSEPSPVSTQPQPDQIMHALSDAGFSAQPTNSNELQISHNGHQVCSHKKEPDGRQETHLKPVNYDKENIKKWIQCAEILNNKSDFTCTGVTEEQAKIIKEAATELTANNPTKDKFNINFPDFPDLNNKPKSLGMN